MLKLTLLYAEDHQESRENYAFVLKDYFHEVYTAKDGKEALDLYHEKKPDILLLDVSMPEIDGLEVAQIIRKENEKIPIIMLTAKVQESDLLRGFDAKVDDYITKPFGPQELLESVEKIIGEVEVE